MNKFMKLLGVLVISISALVNLSGCAGLSQQGNNGLAGAGLGAVIGAIAGDSRIATERGAVAGGILGLLMPTINRQQQQGYGQPQQFYGQQQQGCVQAIVDGRQGCYPPQYLQSLQQQQFQQQQFQQQQYQQQFYGQQGGQPSCPRIYRSGYGWTCQ